MNRWFETPIHRRARPGGEISPLNGRFYPGGELMPFYVPRPVMPQIEEEDYADFLAFAMSRGVHVRRTKVSPCLLHPHQRLDKFHAASLPPEVQAKPIFVSIDNYILDGNHRWMMHMKFHMEVEIIQLSQPFEEAIALMFSFPKTYALENYEGKN